MSLAQIRRHLRKQSETLFFSPAERALLAVLESPSFREDRQAIINADYTRGRMAGEKVVRDLIEGAWSA